MLPLLMCVLLTLPSHKLDRHNSQLRSSVHSEVLTLYTAGLNTTRPSNPKWAHRFSARIPKSEIPSLKRLQKSTDPKSEAACEIAFVLAYYHVDFDANFRRMLRSDYYSYDGESITAGEITEEFADFLYRKYPGQSTLRIWLNTLVDGASAEVAFSYWYSEWKRDRKGMLLAASGSKRRIYNVAGALVMAYEDPAEAEEKIGLDKVQRRINEQLNQLAHSTDPKIARTAKAVIVEMK